MCPIPQDIIIYMMRPAIGTTGLRRQVTASSSAQRGSSHSWEKQEERTPKGWKISASEISSSTVKVWENTNLGADKFLGGTGRGEDPNKVGER